MGRVRAYFHFLWSGYWHHARLPHYWIAPPFSRQGGPLVSLGAGGIYRDRFALSAGAPMGTGGSCRSMDDFVLDSVHSRILVRGKTNTVRSHAHPGYNLEIRGRFFGCWGRHGWNHSRNTNFSFGTWSSGSFPPNRRSIADVHRAVSRDCDDIAGWTAPVVRFR